MEKSLETGNFLKRLELIEKLISLGEIELVGAQTHKLKQQCQDVEVCQIVHELEHKAYGNAARMIAIYISQATAVRIYEDPEVVGLQLEVKALEQELIEFQSIKAEIEKQIHSFNTRYQQELGALIVELLQLRRDRLKEEAEKDPEKQDPYQEAQAEYESYQQIYEEAQEEPLSELTSEEQKELREAFLKASKLCHPDVVADEFKEEAEAIFIELKTAYEQNDLKRVKETLHTLKQGGMPTRKSAEIGDKDKLRAESSRLRTKIQAVRREIEELKHSEVYQTLVGLEDWEAYFSGVKAKLQREVDTLKGTTP